MADVEVRVEAHNDLTVLKVQGELSAADIIRFIDECYNESVTKRILWDGRESTAEGISTDEFRKVALVMKDYAKHRKGGKTALVGINEIDYGLGRMYESLAEMENIPCDYRTFRSVLEARTWLLE